MSTKKNASPRSRRKVFYVVFPLLSLMMTLLAVEAFLAAFNPIPFGMEHNMYFIPDAFTGYRLKPHGVGSYPGGIPANANNHGHRDREVSLSKSAGTTRILLLGDSFTVGYGVYEEEAYPQLLENLLNQTSANPVEVINTGVGGWEPFQYAQYYEHYGQHFAPDLILIGFFVGNDTYHQIAKVEQLGTAIMGRRISRAAESGTMNRTKLFLYEHFNLFRLVLKAFGHALAFDATRKSCEDFHPVYLQIEASRLANHLKFGFPRFTLAQNASAQIGRIQDLADRDSIPLAVVLIPDEMQVNARLRNILVPNEEREMYDFGMPQSMLAQIFARNGITTIDLLSSFIKDPRCLYSNNTHWTAEGHRLAASVIFDEVRRKNLLGTQDISVNAERPGTDAVGGQHPMPASWFSLEPVSPEQAAKIMPIYGETLQRFDTATGMVIDASHLPHSKETIKAAILSLLALMGEPRRVVPLKAAYMRLADFQDGVGDTPVSLVGSGPGEETWQDIVARERNALESELATAKYRIKK